MSSWRVLVALFPFPCLFTEKHVSHQPKTICRIRLDGEARFFLDVGSFV